MPDWKFALEQMTDAVRQMRSLQRTVKTNPSATKLTHCRAIEARVDELVTEAVEFLNRVNSEPVPPLTPDPIDLLPVPMPVWPIDDALPMVPPLIPDPIDFPEVPPVEAPAARPSPTAEVEQKRSRKRGGQHGGS